MGENGPYLPPAESERAFVGVTLSVRETGETSVLALSGPGPPCRTFPVARSVELEPLGTPGRGTEVRRWQVWLGSPGRPKCLFSESGRFFVRARHGPES